MKTKVILTALILMLAASFVIIADDSDQTDADGSIGVVVNSQYTGCTAYIVNNTTGITSATATANNTAVSVSFTTGDSISIYATAGSGYAFNNWILVGQGAGSSNNPYTFTATAGGVYSPTFTQASTYTVSLNVPNTYTGCSATISASGYGSQTASAGSYASLTVPSGTSVTLSASPGSNYTFNSWQYVGQGTASSSNPYTFTVSSNLNFIAAFSQITSYTVSVTVPSGATGCTMTMSAPGYASQSAYNGQTATMTVVNGTSVTLSASPGSNYTFNSWQYVGQGMASSSNPYTFTVSSNLNFIAAFDQITYYSIVVNVPNTYTGCSITMSAPGLATQTATTGNYATLSVPLGTSVTLTASAGSGFSFNSWQYVGQGMASSSNPYTFTATGSLNFIAAFTNQTYTVNLNVPNTYTGCSATISANGYASQTATAGGSATLTVPYGTSVTLSATAATGYTFASWQYVGQGTASSSNPYTFTATASLNFIAAFNALGNYTISVNVPNTYTGSTATISASGYASQTASAGGSASLTVISGTSVTLTASAGSNYTFASWQYVGQGMASSSNPYTFTVSSDLNLIAAFSAVPVPPTPTPTTDGVYWSNDLYNGSVTMAYRFTGGNNNMVHSMNMTLYNGNVTDMVTTWTPSDYSLQIELSYPLTSVSVNLLKNGTVMNNYSVKTEIGQWPGFEITIDTSNGYVTFTPMNNWTNFTSYSTYSDRERVILDWSAETKGQSVFVIEHEDTGSGAHPSFQVVRTMPFLNTYGVVLTDPAINVYSYFPEYDSVRLNFDSFAIYGNSMTVNSKTMSVSDGKVTIYYITNDEVNTWVNIGTPDALSKTFTLSNINITWQEGTCTLTFVSDKFSVNMGSYSAGFETVSFNGLWYFTADLYEPVTSTETVISGDWDYLPDIGAPVMLLIYLGCLFAFAVLAQAEKGLKWMDAAILIIAGLIGFILLG